MFDSAGQAYNVDMNEKIESLEFTSRQCLLVGCEQSLCVADFRSNSGTEWSNLAQGEIYRIKKVDDTRYLLAEDAMENVVSLFDIRNPIRPLQIYTCHDAYVTKFFPLHE